MKGKHPKIKQLWRGSFNYRQSARIEYAYAFTKRQAWAIMCKRLADKDGVGVLTVMSLFNGKKDNHEITLEMAIKEGEEG